MTSRVVAVGLGAIGMTSDLHLNPADQVSTHARAFHLHPSFEMIAGIDGDPKRRTEFEQIYKVAAFDCVNTELQKLSPDVVAISVPTPQHASVLKQILGVCRPKAILCEKPLSYDLSEAKDIVESCERAGCALYVNYVRRADPAVQRIKNMLAACEIRLPVKGIAWYSKGMFNNGSHFLDLLQYWIGPAQTFQIIQKGRSWNGDPEPDVLVNFPGGQVYFLAAKEEDFSYYMIELVSCDGRLRYDLGGEHVLWQPAVKSSTSPGYTVLDAAGHLIESSLSHIQSHVADQLALALAGKPTALASGQQALNTIQFLTTIKNSL